MGTSKDSSKLSPRFFEPLDLAYIVERDRWVLRNDGEKLVKELRSAHPGFSARLKSLVLFPNSHIVHFASQFMFEKWFSKVRKSSHILVNLYHGKFGDEKGLDRNLDFILSRQDLVSRYLVSFTKMRDRIVNLGIPKSQVVYVPIGVDRQLFSIATDHARKLIRSKYGIPENFKIIGSFQKDGIGWGEGLEPKLIKGPDILVETLTRINQQAKIHVVLSGPSRGFVIRELSRRGISYSHHYLKDHDEISYLYKSLDLYLITSREEGGPKGLIEALSSGCPVVSTPVGMALDIGTTPPFYSRVRSFDPNDLAEAALAALKNELKGHDSLTLRALTTNFSFEDIARSHYENLYRPLLV